MTSRLARRLPHRLVRLLRHAGLMARPPAPLSGAALDALYAAPLPPPGGPLSIFHLGHSLVGRDMPAMLAQLAGPDHRYDSQLGWGATLHSHWEPDVPVNGFAAENAHPRYRDAHDAVASGAYDAFVLTEMVEIRAAITYYDSWAYVARWAQAARAARPDVRVYLYETWHHLDDAEGFLARIDRDLARCWEGEILDRALAADGMDGQTVHVIPGGQVMARLARTLHDTGGVAGLTSHEDLFSDSIHFNDLGAYLMALTHYAVLYRRNPGGLPHALLSADGTPATAPSQDAATLMQRVVWEVVTGYPRTGVRAE